MPLGPEENIVRAICTDKYDKETGRISPSLFDKRGNTSVSRLSLISLEDHWDLFRLKIQKPPERILELIGEINVGVLQEIGRTYQNPTELTLEPDPLDWNHAHAVIPQKITPGLATQIVQKLKRHRKSV